MLSKFLYLSVKIQTKSPKNIENEQKHNRLKCIQSLKFLFLNN